MTISASSRLHRLSIEDGEHIKMPKLFTYPFEYRPHPLCLMAVERINRYHDSQEEWHEELSKGKMMGVLVVRNEDDGLLYYLAAYSGQLCGSNDLPYFVPAVYDLMRPDGYFRMENDNIGRISLDIVDMERRWDDAHSLYINKVEMKKAELHLDEVRGRMQGETEDEWRARRQHENGEKKRRRVALAAWEAEEMDKIMPLYQSLQKIKEERRLRSANLQQWLFGQFVMKNARGEQADLCTIFKDVGIDIPPSGAGECCAPKLLQYAYSNGLTPVCMAEWWYGASPVGEIRHHLQFYPACQSKCKPILAFMLRGLNVEPNPLLERNRRMAERLRVIYEDEWMLAVDKPEGMLSVLGKDDVPSVESIIRERWTADEPPFVVHRLDMDTSGIMIIAKSMAMGKTLQRMFASRQIKKRYIAVLDGIVREDCGTIRLPIRPDYDHRPRQMVDYRHGKLSITDYEVIERKGGRTRIALYPHTGRTHQLRMHSAHQDGLNCPIVGDRLYGHDMHGKETRMMLHAESIAFVHPVQNRMIELHSDVFF